MNSLKKIVAIAALLAIGSGAAACAVQPDSADVMGLYYSKGQVDGYQFDHCIPKGQNGDGNWNDEVIWLPTNQRTWTIDDMPDPANPGKFVPAPGADSGDVTIVSAKPEAGQPSGVQVKVATKTSFLLNTFCTDEGADADKGGMARKFWEKFGRRYDADSPDGWKAMLNAELAPTLKTIIRATVREYTADALVANSNDIQAQIQRTVSENLAKEFNRLAGGNFFCGPTFTPAKADCPPLELVIIDVDYADPKIREARNTKQTNEELAAAKVAEAQGILDAAKKQQELYNIPGWVALQKQERISAALVEACKVAHECKLIVGSDGNLVMVQ